MENLHNKSPLRFPGGKTRACKILDEIICKYFDMDKIDIIVAPFFGGGSFEFYLQNKYKKSLIVNDKFRPLYKFWKIVQENKTELCKLLYEIQSVKICKADFTNYQKTIMNDGLTDIEVATRYFVINRCSFSGATLSGGFSVESSNKRFTKSSIDRINALDMQYIQITNLDFINFISNIEDQYKNKNTLMFIDPPYYLENGSKLYGNNGDLHENFQHDKLFDILSTHTNWILTYNNCDYIRNLYSKFIILDVNWSYSMNKSKNSSEIVIISK